MVWSDNQTTHFMKYFQKTQHFFYFICNILHCPGNKQVEHYDSQTLSTTGTQERWFCDRTWFRLAEW